jgi:signal transduction histidine kinase
MLAPRFRDAGIDVEMQVEPVTDLPASLQLAAYRIVQESLTNVVKHVGPATVLVVVASDDGDLLVMVRNSAGTAGRAVPPASSGRHGLAGMRERVAMFGGTVEAGSTADGGFEVRARLPIPVDAPADQLRVAT